MPQLLLGVVFDPRRGRDVGVFVLVCCAKYPPEEMILVLPMCHCSWEKESGTRPLYPVNIRRRQLASRRFLQGGKAREIFLPIPMPPDPPFLDDSSAVRHLTPSHVSIVEDISRRSPRRRQRGRGVTTASTPGPLPFFECPGGIRPIPLERAVPLPPLRPKHLPSIELKMSQKPHRGIRPELLVRVHSGWNRRVSSVHCVRKQGATRVRVPSGPQSRF